MDVRTGFSLHMAGHDCHWYYPTKPHSRTQSNAHQGTGPFTMAHNMNYSTIATIESYKKQTVSLVVMLLL